MEQFKLIIISSESNTSNEVATAIDLFNAGLQTFHLRKPLWSDEEIEQFLNRIPKEFHNRIVLHFHFHLSNKFGLKGIHLNESNKKLLPEFHNYNIISASFHSLQDIEENSFPYQYVFLSPLFESISKPGYNSNFDLNLLADELQRRKKENQQLAQIIALGGVNSGNVLKAKKTGFDGAALMGAIWQSKNPIKDFQVIKSLAETK
jgi:thiamine-phosphate pyrophosphorylase